MCVPTKDSASKQEKHQVEVAHVKHLEQDVLANANAAQIRNLAEIRYG